MTEIAIKQLIYLGISGTLHPANYLFEIINDMPLPGERKFEAVPVLIQGLRDWPDAKIVLTSTMPWRWSLDEVLEWIGPELASRVVGYTHEDLTTQVRKGKLQRLVTNEDYWRMGRSTVVYDHVKWFKPQHWVVIDHHDEHRWGPEMHDHVLQVDGRVGLRHDTDAQEQMRDVLERNFGPPR